MKPLRRSKPMMDPEAGHLPPQAPEMEQLVLAAVLTGKGVLGALSAFLEPDHFYVQANEAIYRAAMDLERSGSPIDVATVAQRLSATGRLDTAGGAFYIAQLTNKLAGVSNAEYHARIIVQKFMRRKLIETCVNSLRDAYDDTVDEFDLMDSHAEGMAAINSITTDADPISMAEVVDNIVNNTAQPKYIHFGFGNLDTHVCLGPGDVCVIGARPAVGKTTFVLNALQNMAKAGHRSLFVSLEMSAAKLGAKVASAFTKIDSERVTRNEIDAEERGRIALGGSENGVWTPRILVDDRPSLRASQVAGICERAVKRHKCDLIVIDYLQLMDGEGDNGHERMSNISKACKQAAKATGIRMVELSQLKRRDGNEVDPQMDDLRESGQIEADGDVVILLGREKGGTEISANVAKNKTGPIGKVRIPFDLMSQRIGGIPSFDPRALPKSVPPPDNRIEPETDIAPF